LLVGVEGDFHGLLSKQHCHKQGIRIQCDQSNH
jgi:hypothetical protein